MPTASADSQWGAVCMQDGSSFAMQCLACVYDFIKISLMFLHSEGFLENILALSAICKQ